MKAKRVIMHIVCITLAIMVILPFVLTFTSATKNRREVSGAYVERLEFLENTIIGSVLPSNSFWDNLIILLIDDVGGQAVPLGRAFFNSFIVAAVSVVLAIYFSSITAYGFVTYRFKGNKALYGFIIIMMMVPGQISILGYVGLLHAIGLYDNLFALIIPAVVSPINVFFMRKYMDTTLSLELVQAGRIDGCSEIGIFHRLILPALKPGMAILALFVAIPSWNSLFLPSLTLRSKDNHTVPMIVNLMNSSKYTTEMGAVFLVMYLSTLPLIIFYLILHKHIHEAVIHGGLREEI